MTKPPVHGTDPVTASIQFYWGEESAGVPKEFIVDEGDERHWFQSGIRVVDRLILFLIRVRSTNTGIGSETTGWTAWMVENPDENPSAWKMRRLETPANPLGVLPGTAGVLLLDEHLYTFGSAYPLKSHPIYAVRWAAEQVRHGNLLNPDWWAAGRLGWVADSSNKQRGPFFDYGASGMTIHLDLVTKQFLAMQTQGFGPADVMMRAYPDTHRSVVETTNGIPSP